MMTMMTQCIGEETKMTILFRRNHLSNHDSITSSFTNLKEKLEKSKKRGKL
jgi:hypothetical protein